LAIDQAVQFVAATRLALSLAGLTRCDIDGSVYWVGGSGKQTVVLVHGVNDQAGTWAAVAPMLASHFRLIIPDIAGHGESAPAAGPIPIPMIVEKLHAIIDREATGKVALVGSSMGAWISILYTLEHPERVEELILESGGGLALPLSSPLVASNREEAIRILHAVHGPNADIEDWMVEAMLERSSNSQMLRVMAAGVFPFVDGRLSQLHVPATVVWGEDDGVVPRTYMETLRKGISKSRLQVIKGAAHIPHRQQPERFVECLMESFSASARD
jgi:pimeloyl-ACP methyl ester carboxylesterase